MSVTWPALYLQFMCTTENYPFKKLVDPYVPILNKLQDTLNEKKKRCKEIYVEEKGLEVTMEIIYVMYLCVHKVSLEEHK